MKRMLTTVLASTALLGSSLALISQEALPDVCQTGFSPADLNDDGKITREEVSAQRDRQFEQIDADNDGGISRDELAQCVGNAHLRKLDAAAGQGKSTDWDNLDLGEQDQLTQRDYVDLARRAWLTDDRDMQAALTGNRKAETEEEYAKNLAEFFRAHDINEDKILVQSEYDTGIDPDGWMRSYLNREYTTLDADDSDSVTLLEYRDAGLAALLAGQEDTPDENIARDQPDVIPEDASIYDFYMNE
jgi:hypothetical protein